MTLPIEISKTVDIIDGLKKVLFDGNIYISSAYESQFKADIDKVILKYNLNEEQIDNLYCAHYNKQFNSR